MHTQPNPASGVEVNPQDSVSQKVKEITNEMIKATIIGEDDREVAECILSLIIDGKHLSKCSKYFDTMKKNGCMTEDGKLIASKDLVEGKTDTLGLELALWVLSAKDYIGCVIR